MVTGHLEFLVKTVGKDRWSNPILYLSIFLYIHFLEMFSVIAVLICSIILFFIVLWVN